MTAFGNPTCISHSTTLHLTITTTVGLTDVPEDESDSTDLPDIADSFSIADIIHLLDRRRDATMLFVVAEYTHLTPGFSYLFRTRGINQAGEGPWSVPTYSTFTNPTIPGTY